MVSRPVSRSAVDSTAEEVPLFYVKPLLVQAKAFGKDVDAIIAAADFPFNPLIDQALPDDQVITIEQYSRLCMKLFDVLEDETGGTIQGVQTPVGTTRMLIYSVIHSQNLREAMERAIEFNTVCRKRSYHDHIHNLTLSEDGKRVTLNYLPFAEDQHNTLAKYGELYSMAIWLRLCSWLVGKNIEVLAAGSTGPVPDNSVTLKHFFSCPIMFEQACNWLTFSAAYLDAPIARSENDVEAFLRVAPYYMVIKPVINEQSVAAHIRQIIGQDLRKDLPTFEQLTGLLNMSARTLRRRLDKEGTSYQRIKDCARRDAAIEFLSNPQLTVSDVAELVGFSDPSAFHRSFKRWTGQSPGEYRAMGAGSALQ